MKILLIIITLFIIVPIIWVFLYMLCSIWGEIFHCINRTIDDIRWAIRYK